MNRPSEPGNRDLGTRSGRGSAFCTEGPVPPSQLYVAREVDARVLSALASGESCHLIGPPGSGKTSLATRLHARLSTQGHPSAQIALSEIGSAESETWHFGLLHRLAGQLSLPDLAAAWQREPLPPHLRWLQLLSSSLPAGEGTPHPVIFLDEVEALFAQPFATDLLRAIRASQGRLTFCLLSRMQIVALSSESGLSAKSFPLPDFTSEEIAPLLTEFFSRAEPLPSASQEAWRGAVFDWTRGHPALTQNFLLYLISEGAPEATLSPSEVASRVSEAARGFSQSPSLWEGPLLQPILRSFERNQSDAGRQLFLYKRLLAQGHLPISQTLSGNDRGPEILCEIGLCREVRQGPPPGQLIGIEPRNPLLQLCFNEEWVRRREEERFLASRLRTWQESNRLPEFLLSGDALHEAEEWARDHHKDVTAEEREFLIASEAHARKAERQTREQALVQDGLERARERTTQKRVLHYWISGLSAAIIALAAVIAWLVFDRNRAHDERRRAEEATRLAKAELAKTETSLGEERREHGATRSTLQQTEASLTSLRKATDALLVDAGRMESRLREVRGEVVSIFKKRVMVRGKLGKDTGINDKSVGELMLGRAWPQIRRCIPAGVPLPQRLKVEVNVEPTGVVQKAEVDGESAKGADLTCVNKALMALRFPSYDGATFVKVIYRFERMR